MEVLGITYPVINYLWGAALLLENPMVNGDEAMNHFRKIPSNSKLFHDAQFQLYALSLCLPITNEAMQQREQGFRKSINCSPLAPFPDVRADFAKGEQDWQKNCMITKSRTKSYNAHAAVISSCSSKFFTQDKTPTDPYGPGAIVLYQPPT
jgi:hypothetical protein